jgi:RNA polymerase sigma-70 factor (ECF subfamily)
VPPQEDTDPARRVRFAHIFDDVYEPLQRYVRRRAGATVVDDVVADVLLVLWRRLDAVPDGAELAWCYGAARRCLANHRRGDERRDRLVRRVAGEPVADPGEPPESDPALSAALDELSTDERELVRLWAWEQLEPRELAVVLGISANAASIRLHRTKRRLAERLRTGKDGAFVGHKPVGDRAGRGEEGG